MRLRLAGTGLSCSGGERNSGNFTGVLQCWTIEGASAVDQGDDTSPAPRGLVRERKVC